MTTRVDGRQVLAYRAFVQGLHREAEDVADLAVLDLGVQDTPPGSAAHALATRLRSPSSDPSRAPGLSATWSVRGAPHVHRTADLVDLSRKLWPWSDDDALARLDTSSSPVRSSGLPAREALRLVAEQIAEIVTQPMPKGEVSTALTPRVPKAMTVYCRSCEATHIGETLFRAAVLPAGIVFEPAQRVVTFTPVGDWPGVPEEASSPQRVVTEYLRLLGPAGPDEVAAFLGTKASDLASRWPDGLAEVALDGRAGWIPEEALATLSDPPDPPAVRLLAPSDPLLQARDRELLVPDVAHRKVLWPSLGRPGGLMVDGEVAGAWRARKNGRRLDVTVQAFRGLPASTRRGIDEQAALAARVRGLGDAVAAVE